MTVLEITPAAAALESLELDLGMVRMKLANPETGEPWSEDALEVAEGEYRKFLALCLAYPGEPIVPCAVVDDIWHAHILDTRAYRQ